MEQTPPSIFNGRMTIEGPKGHRTFQIRTILKGKLKGKRKLELLIGTQNDDSSCYTPFAYVGDKTVYVWRKFQSTNGKPSLHEIYADMIAVRCGGFKSRYGKEYGQYKVLLEKRCLKCNRVLTHPDSIRMGVGPGPHKGD